MSTATILPTLRQRVESALLLHPGRDVTLIRLYQLLPTGLVHSSADEEEDAA